MSSARVKRGPGPRRLLTEATYRKKSLPFLLKDFEAHCAYCLDPGEFRHPSQQHVEHFNCKLTGRRRHRYKNLMLACATCNLSKHDKPVRNPFDREQRLLNCTEESEFSDHITESADGQWHARSKEAEYHLTSICLQERCHQKKRAARSEMASRILSLCKTALQYRDQNPAETQRQLKATILELVALLDGFPPLVTVSGVQAVRAWLADRGVDLSMLS